LPSTTISYFFAEIIVTSGFLSAAKAAAVRAKPKNIVKIFFILLSFIVLSCIATGACKTILLFPVAYYYSKQMPSCQKFEKESLMRLLFKVNENWITLTVDSPMLFSYLRFFYLSNFFSF